MNAVTKKSQDLELVNTDRIDWPQEYQSLRSDRERLFVLLYMRDGNGANAAREAGYGNAEGTTTPENMARIAYRLLTTDRVVEAVQAITKRQVRALGPDAVTAIKGILRNPFHKDLGKVALAIAERADPTVHRITGEIKHTHTLDHEAEAVAQLQSLKALGVARDKLTEVFGEFGLQRLEAKLEPASSSQVIDAEFSEVSRDPDADILGE